MEKRVVIRIVYENLAGADRLAIEEAVEEALEIGPPYTIEVSSISLPPRPPEPEE